MIPSIQKEIAGVIRKSLTTMPDDELVKTFAGLPVAAAPSVSKPVSAAPKAVSAAKVATARPAGARDGKVKAKPAKAGKRSPKEMGEVLENAFGTISDNPGRTKEELKKLLGLSSDDSSFDLPIRKLLEKGRLRTEGQKRATRYFAVTTEPVAEVAPEAA